MRAAAGAQSPLGAGVRAAAGGGEETKVISAHLRAEEPQSREQYWNMLETWNTCTFRHDEQLSRCNSYGQTI